MLKKAGIVAAAAASLMMFGAPAFAAPAGPPATTHSGTGGQSSAASGIDTDEVDQNALVNLNDTQILDNLNICEIIPIIEVEIPIGDGAQGTNCQVADAQENQGVSSANSEDPK
ncbi:hypothetical protein [Goodfellowiella coeruleoviolacea]|uniref:Secreted protein n=1 Tax=Goodfellowiella coeruleoviolacea TaxID=334858 RepID=A0AAE3GCR4_9PSEU|nr:hypothetical protein [Goodfellowiella coeruleoviolacea]MCP2165685.1 hypothetical protein [Goodfellowiella coeruleoviolacea]